jgi:hypothetical protein
VRLTREIFTVAGDPAGTGWLSPFPPKHHEKDLPTSIEIWAGDSNRATDLVDAIQVAGEGGGGGGGENGVLEAGWGRESQGGMEPRSLMAVVNLGPEFQRLC